MLDAKSTLLYGMSKNGQTYFKNLVCMYASLMYVQPFLKIALACLIVVGKNGGGIIWAVKVSPKIFKMRRGNQNNFGNLALQ